LNGTGIISSVIREITPIKLHKNIILKSNQKCANGILILKCDIYFVEKSKYNSCTVIKIYIYLNTYLLTLPLFRSITGYHLHSYLSGFFISAGVPNGEFPEILIAKCRSRFYWIRKWVCGTRLDD
jgi:hypothetical protein